MALLLQNFSQTEELTKTLWTTPIHKDILKLIKKYQSNIIIYYTLTEKIHFQIFEEYAVGELRR